MEIALWVNEQDNVATVFSECVKKGCTVCIVDKKGNQHTVVAQNDIPYAHKIAIQEIQHGSHIIKYGQSLGVATEKIGVGEHVHIHNLDSERGRGDKQGVQYGI